MQPMSVQTLLKWSALGAVVLTTGLLGGCESRLRLSQDFGSAVRENVAAQIADPDAHYSGAVPPGSDGARTVIAQTRYRNDKVLQPPSAQTSSVSSGGGGGGGGSQ